MKLVIDSNELRNGFNKILTVVDKRNSRPILTNCLVSINNGQIEISATDLEVSAKVILKAETESEGKFCLNIKNTSDILRELPHDKVVISIDESKNILNLTCKNIDYSLVINSAEDFPYLSFDKEGNDFQLPSRAVHKIIHKTSHAISTDETRINLNGIFLQKIDSKLRAVAIDGHRLALLNIENFEGQSDYLNHGVIIPRKGITELKKIADAYLDSNLKFNVDDSYLYAYVENEYYLSIRLIAREYPKYQTVIPSKTTFSFKVDKSIILDSIKRISILSNEKTNGVKLSITSSELVISANHPSMGFAKEVVPIECDDIEMEIGFNAKYMIDSISALDDHEVIFEFNNELSPVIVRTQEEEEFLGIIMPLKL